MANYGSNISGFLAIRYIKSFVGQSEDLYLDMDNS